MEKTLDITLDELLNKLGKTKKDLVMELDELNKWMETTNYRHGLTGMKGFVSLGYMFYKKKVFEGKVDDVLNRADDWGYDISWEEAEEVVILFQRIYDCRVSGWNEEIKQLIKGKKFLFGGRILANRGLESKGRKVSLSNCYVIEPPEDNIESIFDCAKKLARTYSYGGGCGVDISKLSPRGAKVNNAAKETTGSISFMDLYSMVTGLIGQAGRRK